ncbi:TetR/AcrR family transcriptional regulator [Rhodobacteraceae bacterium RKSG542]|uniref:TetR/AcrR family transcriptional regulator n=1 Tax=Pseudovibrio flavus TaxID=2529854 RepID=UPI0012BBFCFD|nr:TetR/AcrR family transcriptional regulator [Pseudovibrio flavus]MTI16305.1 TetR/AcrR family transcriptional regulator [Pseudovibrio flavus]
MVERITEEPLEAKSHQQRKSDRMRREIVLAAISCLHKNGYHRASIKKIALESSFSQGALQHHFPTKEDLMVFVMDKILTKSLNLTLEWAEEIGRENIRISDMTKVWWSNQMRSPEFLAMLEIMVGARTDDSLRNRLKPVVEDYGRKADERVIALFPESVYGPAVTRVLITASRSMLCGFVTYDAMFRDAQEMDRLVEEWAEILDLLLAPKFSKSPN